MRLKYTSTNLKLSFLFLLCFTSLTTFSQNLTNRLFGSGNADVKGYLEHLPDDYNTTNGRYPVIIFFHGAGEFGNGTSDLAKISSPGKGLASLINSGGFPASFTVNGKVYKFIVISPQSALVSWLAPDVDFAIQQTLAIYKDRIDMQRVYLTGLSAGGGGIWAWLGNNGTASTIAATVICAGAHPAVGSFADNMVKGGIPIWAFHNQFDPTVPLSYTTDWYAMLTSKGLKPPMLETIYPGVAQHDCWTETYNPTSTQHANIYNWMLGYSRPGIANPGAVANKPPVSNPGVAQTITLPAGVTLNGSASSDPDGSLVSWLWKKVSGPAGDVIKTPTAASTALTFTTAGTYVYSLAVTDNGGLTTSANVTVTVNAAAKLNVPPVSNPGVAQTITLPAGVTLNGSASSDPDGSLVSWFWTKVSGPAGDVIKTPNAASTAITFTTAGAYVYSLAVTDNSGSTVSAHVSVTVNAAAKVNVPPVSNPGIAQTITLPAGATLNGSASSDPDGNLVSWFWTKVSGPAGDVIKTPNAASTAVTFTAAGAYVYSLAVTDNSGKTVSAQVSITVNAAPSTNTPPVSNPGVAQTIILPASATLNGSASHDPDGSLVSWYWTKVSGPAGDVVKVPNAATTAVTFTTAGVYVYSLAVTDNSGKTVSAQVRITVNAATIANKAPVASAGYTLAILLPYSATLTAAASTDPDGTIVSYLWSKVSGPAGDIIRTPSEMSTTITFVNAGVYVYKVIVTDNKGMSSSSQTSVTVSSGSVAASAPSTPSNTTLVASAGLNRVIYMPANSTVLDGSASKGTMTSCAWKQVSGPASLVLQTPGEIKTGVIFTGTGLYVFSLTIKNSAGTTSSATVQVSLNPSGTKTPIAFLGNSVLLDLTSNNTIMLDGSDLSSKIGANASYSWVKISGPGGDKIQNLDLSRSMVQFAQAGAYDYQLQVKTDSGSTNSEKVHIQVDSASNQGLVTASGYYSDNMISLTSFTKSDAPSLSYKWVMQSGPNRPQFSSDTLQNTLVSRLSPGTYTFELVAFGGAGKSSTSSVKVGVPIDENSGLTENDPKIYPNPASATTQLQLKSAETGIVNVALYTYNGGYQVKAFQSKKTESLYSQNIDLSALPKGFYIVKFNLNGINKSMKLVKY